MVKTPREDGDQEVRLTIVQPPEQVVPTDEAQELIGDIYGSLGLDPVEEVNEGEPTSAEMAEVFRDLVAKVRPDAAGAIYIGVLNRPGLQEGIWWASAFMALNNIDVDIEEVLELMMAKGLIEEMGPAERVSLPEEKAETPLQVVGETREDIYRRQLHDACADILSEKQLELLLTTNPLGDGSIEERMYNIAVILVGQALFEEMDKGSIKAATSKVAKRRAKKALEENAEIDAMRYLAERGFENPAEEEVSLGDGVA